jgi:protein-L-isoaspartate(D-aspartate) O-methyltransferase
MWPLIIISIILIIINTNKAKEVMASKDNQGMIKEQILTRNITDKKVIEAMSLVDRELFVDQAWRYSAYTDSALPIACGQTISQPYIVSFMTEAAQLNKEAKVLEIGTGSGYQAAVLAKICTEVYTIELAKELAESAIKNLKELNYNNVHVIIGNGYDGYPEAAPFDAIIVTAAPSQIPATLIKQLKLNGRLIIPVGDEYQELLRITKTKTGEHIEKLIPVRFVPMVNSK